MYNLGFLDTILGWTVNVTEKSFQLRLFSILGNLQAFINHPIFGCPVEECFNYRRELISLNTPYTYAENLNTFPAVFAYLGFYMGFLYLVSLFKMIKSLRINIISLMCVFGAIILSTSNENMTTSLFIVVIILLFILIH